MRKWLVDGSAGKRARLNHVCGVLGLDAVQVGGLRYQLLHRTASALIEAERFHAGTAVMLVHSFSPTAARLVDYVAFAAAMGVATSRDSVVSVGERLGRELCLGWVSDAHPT